MIPPTSGATGAARGQAAYWRVTDADFEMVNIMAHECCFMPLRLRAGYPDVLFLSKERQIFPGPYEGVPLVDLFCYRNGEGARFEHVHLRASDPLGFDLDRVARNYLAIGGDKGFWLRRRYQSLLDLGGVRALLHKGRYRRYRSTCSGIGDRCVVVAGVRGLGSADLSLKVDKGAGVRDRGND